MTVEQEAATYRALIAEAAQILPTPKEVASHILSDQFLSAGPDYCKRAFATLLGGRDLLHLARRDAGFAALRAALTEIVALHTPPKGQSFSSVCICAACLPAISALATTEPGAALGTVIEALTALRDASNPGDASEPISAQIVFEQAMKALHALGFR